MTVAVIGAGVAGLATARELSLRGAAAIVFERDGVPGGRVATNVIEGYVFDTGAQSIVPHGSELTDVMLSKLDTRDLVHIQTPVFVHEHLRVMPGDPRRNSEARYTYGGGMAELPKLLSKELDVRLNCNVTEIERADNQFMVLGEVFDAVVTTVPVPQASVLLWGLGAHKATAQSRYRSCLSVLLGFEVAPPTNRYHAIVTEEESHPLQWLSLETVKAAGRSPAGTTALVAQLSTSFSRTAWDWEDQRIIAEAAGFVKTLFGAAWIRPVVSRVIRWKYSQPEAIVLFDSLNHRNERLVISGDGVAGGRIEYAFASGLRAARLLTEELGGTTI
ncbi:MAG: NAD(P)/FAD-dependent oxidoreductase [Fimbriimonadaceae bacterium]